MPLGIFNYIVYKEYLLKSRRSTDMFININGVEIYYEIKGEGYPVLFIHGYYADHRLMKGMMEPIIGDLNYKRIYLDLPGMGKTKNYDSVESADDFVNIICSFASEVVGSEKFVIIGFSYGGYLARAVHYKMKEQVGAIALICPAIYSDRKKRELPKQVILKENKLIKDYLSDLEILSYNKVCVIQDEKIITRFKNEILISKDNCDMKFLVKMLRNNYNVSFSIDELMEPYCISALIVCGRQDSVVGYKDAFRLMKNYPYGDYHVLNGAGHNVHFEREKAFDNIFKEWFENLI